MLHPAELLTGLARVSNSLQWVVTMKDETLSVVKLVLQTSGTLSRKALEVEIKLIMKSAPAYCKLLEKGYW